MKSYRINLLLFSILFLGISFISNAATTVTSVKTGNWNDVTTWSSGAIPTSTENVVIDNNHIVTIATTQSIAVLTINGTNASTYGKLIITTGADLTTTASTTVYGKLDINGGTFNEGNSSGDKLTINGTSLGSACLFSMSGGTLNTSRYFVLSNSSSFEMSGGTININSKGGSSSTNIFYLPSGTSFTMSAGTINILNGNLGPGAALKFNPTSSSVTGGTINFTNVKGYSSTTMISSNSLYNINSDVGAGDTLVIQNMSVSTGGFTCHNLSITSGTVQIDPGFGITVSNALTNNLAAANLVIASDTTGNGSLIVNGTVTGSATVQRYIAAYTAAGNGWHEISSPVSSMTIAGTDWDPTVTGANNDLYYWSETGNLWMNYRTATFNFTAGTGYLVANNANLTHSFTGTLNNADVTVSGLTYTAGQGTGWHLLGNPFPSAIKWNDGNWTLTNVGGTAEIWDEAIATYVAVQANGIIPSTNGFFVQVGSGGGGVVTIPAVSRIHDATNNYKSASAKNPAETLTFKISNDANKYADESILGFRSDATKGWDIAFDARKMLSFVKASPQIWTASEGEKYLVNYLPLVTTATNVPLDFRAGVNTVYHLTIKGADSFQNVSLILEDLQTGQKIDLSRQNSYDFSATTGEDESRFVLHINGVTAVPNVSETDGVQVFSFGNTVYLQGRQSLNGKISIFNTLGQKVYGGVLNGAVKQQIRLNERQGVYFVRFQENSRVVTQKVFIK